MKCIRCGNEVNSANGIETEAGWVHTGCHMLMENPPKPKLGMSREDFLKAAKKVAEINARDGKPPVGREYLGREQ